MARNLLLPLLLSPAFTNGQTVPTGHKPGSASHHGFSLCDLKNDKMLVGEISVSRDATLFAGFSSSTASMEKFVAGRTPDGVRRALLSFDLTSVDWPSDVLIACAEVRLAVDTAASVSPPPSSNEMTLHKVTKAWNTNGVTSLDGINGGTAEHGDATWQYASYPTEEWHTPGGDFTSDSLSLETIINSADGIQYAYFGSSKRLHALVNEWIASPSDNHGMLIKADELADDPVGFNVYHGIENNPNLIPKLIVVYTAPSLGFQPSTQHTDNMPHLGGNSTSSSPISHHGGGNTDTPTETSTELGDGTHLGNIKPTFPPINNDAKKQSNFTPAMRKSNSNHEYIAVAATCSVVSVLLVGLSVLTMRVGAPQPRQMTADEVIGNDLSLSSDRELV